MKIIINDIVIEDFKSERLQNKDIITFDFEGDSSIGLELAQKINDLLELLKDNDISIEIRLIIDHRIAQIDLVIFGIFFVLLKLSPDSSIYFIFPHLSTAADQESELWTSEIIEKVKQYIASLSISNEQLNFYIVENNKKPVRFKNSPEFQNWRVQSSKFLPVLNITENNFYEFFYSDSFWSEKKESLDSKHEEILNWEKFKDKKVTSFTVNEITAAHIKSFIKSNTNKFSIHTLTLLSYINLLKDLRAIFLIFDDPEVALKDIMLGQYFKKSKETPFSKGLKNSENISSYFSILEKIHFRLQSKPPLFIMLYCVIAEHYAKNLSTDRAKPSFSKDFASTLEHIFTRVDKIFTGLKEIAQNIIEHTLLKEGVLLVRLFTENEIISFKKDILPGINSYLSSLKEKITYNKYFNDLYLDINILDISEKGILQSHVEKSNLDNHPVLGKLDDFFDITPASSNERVLKTTANIGLVTYAYQIGKKANGFFCVSTPHKEDFDFFSTASVLGHLVPIYSSGTIFTSIIPLAPFKETSQEYIKREFSNSDFFSPSEKQNLFELEYFSSEEDFSNSAEKAILLHFHLNHLKLSYSATNKYLIEREIESVVSDILKKSGENKILPILDFTETLFQNDLGIVLRIIARMQQNFNFSDLIVVGVSFSVCDEIINILKPIDGFWKTYTTRMLFYSKTENGYFIPILFYGKSFSEFLQANYEFLQISLYGHSGKVDLNTEDLQSSLLFYSGNILRVKEFDILIKINGKSLFEIFAQKCLETEINDEQMPQSFSDKRFQGYKISNGHFKIGSKIHITDFYYAKRMFQINEFAVKFSLLIVNYWLEGNKSHFEEKLKAGVTILGYAKYSDLIVLKACSILQHIYPKYKENINTNIVQDFEEPRLVDKLTKTNKYILLVIPIASTFSTSFKIIEYLKKEYNDISHSNFILPIINIINVADTSAINNENLEIRKIKITDTKLYQYGWREIDYNRNLVSVKSQVSYKKLSQRYFIYLPTKWYDINSCDVCFGLDEKITELPLVETDKASVTPQLIFGDGLNFTKKSSITTPYSSQYHHYGHYTIDKRHNVHFIDPRTFLTINKPLIIKWLIGLKKTSWYTKIFGNVTLITSDGNFNSNFVHLANEILFNDGANIIKYDPYNDYVSNFNKFYGNIITNSSVLIYVDDQISTGDTFAAVKNLIKSCTANSTPKKITCLLTLICRSDDETLQTIQAPIFETSSGTNKEDSIYVHWFKYLRIPTVISSHLPCPICLAQEYYYTLSFEAALDPTKFYLFIKGKKLTFKETLDDRDFTFHSYDSRINEDLILSDNEINEPSLVNFFKTPYQNDNLLKLIIENYLYKISLLIKNKGFSKIYDIESLSDEIYHEIKKYSPLITPKKALLLLLKVLSFSPFINHYEIRKVVFQELISLLDIEFINLEEDQNLTVERLRIIKLLLKRISHLKGNYLIREENIPKLLIFYNAHKNTKDSETKADYSIDKHIIEIIKNIGLSYYLLHVIFDEKTKFFDSDLEDPLNIETLQGIELIKLDLERRLSEWKENETHTIGENESTFRIDTLIDIFERFQLQFRRILKKLDSKNIGLESGSLNKVIYSCRALKNLEYKIRIRTDFHYFIAHVIKEITYKNDAKAIQLDTVMSLEYQKLRERHNYNLPIAFRQLIRIIKLENISILKNVSTLLFTQVEMLEPQFKEESINEDSTKIIDMLSKNENAYLFQTLISFLGLEATVCDKEVDNLYVYREKKISSSYIHYVLLHLFLERDHKISLPTSVLKAIDKSLEAKIDYIITRIKHILKVDNESLQNIGYNNASISEKDLSEIFFFVRYKPIVLGKPITEDDLTFYPRNGTYEMISGLDNSFVLDVINGLSLRLGGGTQNIFEFIFNDETNHWESLKHYYVDKSGETLEDTEKNDKYFLDSKLEGELYRKKYSHLLFFRISDLRFNKIKGEKDITNNGQAVILIASTRKSFLKAEKLRYLTILKDPLLAFLKLHYSNDSFRAFQLQQEKNSYYRTLRHGFGRYADYMKQLFDDLIETKNEATSVRLQAEYSLFFTISFDEVQISSILSNLIYEADIEKLKEVLESYNYSLETITVENLINIATYLSPIISASQNIEENRGTNYFVHDFTALERYKTTTFTFSEPLLNIIIAEVLINIKKNEKIVGDIAYVKWSYNTRTIAIDIVNTYDPILQNQNKKDDRENNGIGLSMIGLIFKSIYKVKSEYKRLEDNKFLTSLPLRTI